LATDRKFMRVMLALVGLDPTLAAVFFISARRAALRALETEKLKSAPASYPAEIKELGPLDRVIREGWRIIATGREIRDIALFESRVWAATSGGLLSISPDGRASSLYTRLNGLPDSDVTFITESEGKLYAGTASGALLVIKGGRLTSISFRGKALGRITSLLPAPGGALIGTAESGVWRFDGRAISDFGEGRAGADFKRVTALHRFGGNLAVGALDNGLYIEGPAGFSHYTTEQGLPMNQVTALGECEGALLVGTPLGWATMGADGAIVNNTGAFVTAITNHNGDQWIGTGSGVMMLGKDADKSRALEGIRITALKSYQGVMYAGTDNGIFKLEGGAWSQFYRPEKKEIAGNHITGIMPLKDEVWVGTFENGVDILDAKLSVKARPADAAAWAVNGLLADGNMVYVAHNAGASVYRGGTLVKHLTNKDGLIGRRVSAICAVPGGRAYATEAGVTIESGGLMRSLYAFQGLANNHAYACAAVGGAIYIGTLGGLNAIENMKVKNTWRPGESPLKTGWITALAVSGDDLFVGTYGGGVMKLSASGQWTDYGGSIGAFEVNPGAILAVPDCLLVGSLDRGLFVMNLADGKWRNITDGIASLNVTSLARAGDFYYIGTDKGITVAPRRDIE